MHVRDVLGSRRFVRVEEAVRRMNPRVFHNPSDLPFSEDTYPSTE